MDVIDGKSALRDVFSRVVGMGSSEHDFEGALLIVLNTTSLETTSKEDMGVSEMCSFTDTKRSLVCWLSSSVRSA